MKIEANSRILFGITSRLVKVIDARSPLEIMKDFYIKVYGGKMYITAMNSCVTAVENMDVATHGGDVVEFCVDAVTFSAFMKKIKIKDTTVLDMSIGIEAGGRVLDIVYSSGVMSVPYEGVTLFPAVVKPGTGSRSFSVSGELLDRMMSYVVPVVDEEETLRPILRYISVAIKDSILTVIGASSPEMRRCRADVDVDKDIEVSMLIDTKFYDVIRWYISKKESINIVYDDDKTYILVGGAYLYQVNPSGTYPNCDMIMSKCDDSSCTQSFIVNPVEFLSDIEVVEIGSQKIFTINIEDDNDNNGSAYLKNMRDDSSIDIRQSFKYKKVEGHNGFCCSFNVQKFKNALKNIESSEIEIKKSDVLRCAYFDEVDSMGVSKLFLLMSFSNI